MRVSCTQLLPLADKLKLLSLAETLLNVPSNLLFGAGVFLLLGGARRATTTHTPTYICTPAFLHYSDAARRALCV